MNAKQAAIIAREIEKEVDYIRVEVTQSYPDYSVHIYPEQDAKPDTAIVGRIIYDVNSIVRIANKHHCSTAAYMRKNLAKGIEELFISIL